MTAVVTEIRPGCKIKFLDGDRKSDGLMNGEPIITWSVDRGLSEVLLFIPVHVREGNRNVFVAAANILGVEA